MNARELAVEILSKVEERRAYADILLDDALDKHPLQLHDRGLATQLVYGTLRWRGRVDWLLGRILRRPLSHMDSYLRNLLRLTLYQLIFLDRVPAFAAVNEGVELAKRHGGPKAGGLVNAVMHRHLAGKNGLCLPDSESDSVHRLAVLWSHPDWLVARWLGRFGSVETEGLLQANNQEAPLILRANRLAGPRDRLLQDLCEQGFEAVPARWSPQGIRVNKGSSVSQLPGFDSGLFQVQGEASQMIGYLVDPKPGEHVLDACAAPGGKATHLAELMGDGGEVIATDRSGRGLEKLQKNVQRLGIKSVRFHLADVTEGLTGPLARPYDRILVDAPCSGLGTLRSHPETKWLREEDDIRRLSRLQRKILERTSPHLRAGGILVYAACTLTQEENEGVIEAFLSRQREFILEDAGGALPQHGRQMTHGKFFMALPHRHDTDGFFAARMRKVA